MIKSLILSLLFVFFVEKSTAQKIQIINQPISSDSSFYHIEKINSNEFWAGGEYGVLKKIDSLGVVKGVDFPNEGLDILKIKRINNYVFIITGDAVIYRYDLKKRSFIKKRFPKFDNKCFYDLIELQNGKLLVCGGVSGISKAEKKIPKGFIAVINQELTEIDVVWKGFRKFVWSLLELENGNVIAATFNGINTKIIKTKNNLNWKKETKIKGLVHEIAFFNGEVWFSGAKSIRFREKGMLQKNKQQEPLETNTGCLWSMDVVKNKIISVTASNNLVVFNRKKNTVENIKIDASYALYDIEKISESKALLVGHGKGIFIIDFLD